MLREVAARVAEQLIGYDEVQVVERTRGDWTVIARDPVDGTPVEYDERTGRMVSR